MHFSPLYHHRRVPVFVVLLGVVVLGVLLYSATVVDNHSDSVSGGGRRKRGLTMSWDAGANVNGSSEVPATTSSRRQEPKLVILMWTRYFMRDALAPWPTGIPDLQNISGLECFRGCEMVANRTALSHADAVLFHAFDFKKSDMPPKTRRNPNQMWVFLQQESPVYSRADLKAYSGIFNWTMTYRRDSDVFHPYGKIDLLPDEEAVKASSRPKIQAEIDSLLSKKWRLVAGVISRCSSSSLREVLISQLRLFIPVDIYGKCGTPSGCPRRANPGSCSESAFWSNLTSTYKFYLAFENSLCADYVTEKLFRSLELGLVPVVLGGANYSQLAPPHSFIDARQFKSARELAEFLIKLDKDPKEYRKYFQWRFKYAVRQGDGYCTLCRKLRKTQIMLGVREKKGAARPPKVYSKLQEWWFNSPPPPATGGNVTIVQHAACLKPSIL